MKLLTTLTWTRFFFEKNMKLLTTHCTMYSRLTSFSFVSFLLLQSCCRTAKNTIVDNYLRCRKSAENMKLFDQEIHDFIVFQEKHENSVILSKGVREPSFGEESAALFGAGSLGSERTPTLVIPS